MKYIAIIGYGVVGGGITEVVSANREKMKQLIGEETEVKYIVDIRDFPGTPYADRVVHDLSVVLEDKDVSVVCETMGGSHPAYEFSLRCMEAGKSVVTSNKEVVANFGAELLEAARRNGVHYMFEASVGGGIPCLRPFLTSFAGDNIRRISGIVNGTTNYILTMMKKEGLSFEDALAQAQALGYAERDPSADIDGKDAQRKIIILSALASGKLLPADAVYTESLRKITQADLSGAAALDGEVKLIANAEITDGKLCAYVSPMIVPHGNSLAMVEDVYNAVCVGFEMTGDVMLYGRGAGRYPTAGAVVSDVCAILSGAVKGEAIPVFTHAEDTDYTLIDSLSFAYYVRTADGADKVKAAFGEETKILSEKNGVTEFVTAEMTGGELTEIIKKAGLDTESILRIKETL